jgi:pimeloyl-ACP methyl ester carboxylesterase
MAVTAVLFIHGFPFDHAMWRHQVTALSRWQSIAPDLPGVGETRGPESTDEYSVALYAADLVAVLDRLKVEQAVICGLSMGGYIAFELLRSHAQRVRGAILCNTKAAADTPEAKRDRDAMAMLAKQSGSSAIAEALLPKLLARATFERRPEIVSEVRGMMTRVPVPGIVGALHALRERSDSTPLLKTIHVPVLVIAGEEDQIAPAAGMREMADAIPGARFVVIPEAGHVAPLERPDAVNTAIGEFLRKLG